MGHDAVLRYIQPFSRYNKSFRQKKCTYFRYLLRITIKTDTIDDDNNNDNNNNVRWGGHFEEKYYYKNSIQFNSIHVF
jgi:hypothetical protein